MIDIYYPLKPGQHKQISNRWADLMEQAKAQGIMLEKNGEFTGKATGKVLIDHNQINIEISKKPFLVPEFAIRQALKKLLDEFFA